MVRLSKVTINSAYVKYCSVCSDSGSNILSFPELTEEKRKELNLPKNFKELCAPCFGKYIRDGTFTVSIGKAAPDEPADQAPERLHVSDDGEVSLTNAMGDKVEVSW